MMQIHHKFNYFFPIYTLNDKIDDKKRINMLIKTYYRQYLYQSKIRLSPKCIKYAMYRYIYEDKNFCWLHALC